MTVSHRDLDLLNWLNKAEYQRLKAKYGKS